MFLSDSHQIAHRLATGPLGLNLEAIRWLQGRHYLRGTHIDNQAFETSSASVPYRLADAERAKHPVVLLIQTLRAIVPDLDDLWPLKPTGDPRITRAQLRSIRHKGRLLHQCGFWNVLCDVISNEAYALLLTTIGLASALRNVNAYDAVWTLLRNMDPRQTYFTISGGYQQVVRALLMGAATTVVMETGRRLVQIDRRGEMFVLRFATAEGEVVEQVRKVILALPRRPLSSLAFVNDILRDKAGFNHADAVLPAQVCRVYLTFDQAWWEGAHGVPDPSDVTASFTDTAMRQCSYFGHGANDGPALLMAVHADDAEVGFWRSLAGCGEQFVNPALDPHDRRFASATSTVVATAVAQLCAMHPDKSIPHPTGALFVDWGSEFFGGAWHDWVPGIRSWEIAPRIRRPDLGLDLFICGEAYSGRQGWVEGALDSAETVMRHLGLSAPDWLAGVECEFDLRC